MDGRGVFITWTQPMRIQRNTLLGSSEIRLKGAFSLIEFLSICMWICMLYHQYLDEWGRILRCCASKSCCWMRYCWCKAWGRNEGPDTSWNWGGAGRAVSVGWCAVGRWAARPACGVWLACPRGNSAEMGAWGAPRWKCRQEVAWLCWCLLKCAPMWNKGKSMRENKTVIFHTEKETEWEL